MIVESTFPLTPHFATLFLDKNPNLYLVDEGMYLLQVVNFSCIAQNFQNYYEFLK
jgi:hypothetical protein